METVTEKIIVTAMPSVKVCADLCLLLRACLCQHLGTSLTDSTRLWSYVHVCNYLTSLRSV